jgi:integrase
MPSASLVLSGSSEPDDDVPAGVATLDPARVRVPLDEREWLVLRQRDAGIDYAGIGTLLGAGAIQVKKIEARAAHKLLVNLAYDDLAGIVDGEVIPDASDSPAATADSPTRKELIARGRVALADLGYNPDEWVDAETAAELQTATSAKTLEALYWGWGRFIHYCGVTSRSHEMPTSATIRQYVKDHWHMVHMHGRDTGRKRGRYGQPYSPRTVELAVYVISMICNRLDWPNPVRNPKVHAQLTAYRIKYEDAGFRTDEADPLTMDQMAALVRSCDLRTVGGLRTAVMVRLQCDTGARGGELAAVQMSDVQWISDTQVLITFVTTKGRTRKRSSSRVVSVQATPLVGAKGKPIVDEYRDIDPVKLLRAWWNALRAAGYTSGPLFRRAQNVPPRRNGWPDGDELFGKILDTQMTFGDYDGSFRRTVERTGLNRDPETGERTLHVTTHSCRRGFITRARQAGIPLEEVARRTGHSPTSPSLVAYYEVDEQWGLDNLGVRIRLAARAK